MPYKSIDDLPDSVKVLPKDAQELFLEVLNKALKQYDNEGQAFAVAWSVIKKQYKKTKDGKWVKKAALAPWAKPLIIEGPAIPIGKKNKNGWGIKESEVKNVVESLKRAVVRVCSRDNEHACDENNDPFAEIGRVVDVRVENGFIKPQVAITDRFAKIKIEDGTWEPNWSVYGIAHGGSENGWAKNVEIKSLTLVRFPAWEEATFNIASSERPVEFTLFFANHLKSLYEEGEAMLEECGASASAPQEEDELEACRRGSKKHKAILRIARKFASASEEVEILDEIDEVESAEKECKPCDTLADQCCSGFKLNGRELTWAEFKNWLGGKLGVPEGGRKYLRNLFYKAWKKGLISTGEMKKLGFKVREAEQASEIGGENMEENKRVEELEAEVKRLKEENEKLKAEFEERIQAAIKQREEELRREQLAAAIADLMLEAGVIKADERESRIEMLKEICSAKLEVMKADFEELAKKKVKASETKEIKFKASEDEAKDEVLIEYGGE